GVYQYYCTSSQELTHPAHFWPIRQYAPLTPLLTMTLSLAPNPPSSWGIGPRPLEKLNLAAPGENERDELAPTVPSSSTFYLRRDRVGRRLRGRRRTFAVAFGDAEHLVG